MESRMWVVLGLFLQFLSAVPPIYVVWRPDPIKFNQETGIITQIEEKLSCRERILLIVGLGLLLVGTFLQAVGAWSVTR